MSNEWDAKAACNYWPDQREHWAPVSWKDHLFDFNVFYNGHVQADPVGIGLNPNIVPEQAVFASELRVVIGTSDPLAGGGPGADPTGRPGGADQMLVLLQNPDGRQVASWGDGSAPVYRLDHNVLGTPLVVRQSQFAHLPGGRRTRRGDEPLFLWMRFELLDLIEQINRAERIYITLTVLRPSTLTGMGSYNNINFNFGYGVPAYPLPLAFDGAGTAGEPGYVRHAHPPFAPHAGAYRAGLRNRLAVPGGRAADTTVRFAKSSFFSAQNGYLSHLTLSFPVRKGAGVDVLFPYLPVDDATLDPELHLGYDAALAETGRFWKRELATPTRIRLPEPLLQGWVDALPRLTAMIAQRHPANGSYGLPSGALHYEAIWPTPMALQLAALDFVGQGKAVDQYLEPFRLNQGQCAPPSPHLSKHPGYLGAPRDLTGIDWITDHAAVLWAAVNHADLTMDPDFLERWLPVIERACQFTCDARRVKVPDCYPGVMPPARASDSAWVLQAVWSDGWHHKALRAAAGLLGRLGRPSGKIFLREADAYRKAFRKAFTDVMASVPIWTTPEGEALPFVPATLNKGGGGPEAGHAFALDVGALTLVFGELLEPDDPAMRAALRWYREGPPWRLFRPFSSEWQSPVLDHEISSCEPCYSWNIFHTHTEGDRELFSMGLYSLFAAGASRQNFVSVETRNAVSGNCFTHGAALLLLRLAVIEEQNDTLRLMRMTPLAFLREGGFAWTSVPTRFGPLSLSARLEEGERVLRVEYKLKARHRPERVLLHLPPVPALEYVVLNGRRSETTGGEIHSL